MLVSVAVVGRVRTPVLVGMREVEGVGRLVFDMMVDFPERDSMFLSRLTAVFILWSNARRATREGCDLDPDPAVFGFYGLAAPGKGVALHLPAPDSQRRTFMEKEVCEGVGMRRLGEHLQQNPGSSLLHLRGDDGDVKCPGLHEPACEMGHELRGLIIQIGLELNESFGEEAGRACRLPGDEAQDVWDLKVIATRSISDRFESHGRDGAESVGDFGEHRCSGRGDELCVN